MNNDPTMSNKFAVLYKNGYSIERRVTDLEHRVSKICGKIELIHKNLEALMNPVIKVNCDDLDPDAFNKLKSKLAIITKVKSNAKH